MRPMSLKRIKSILRPVLVLAITIGIFVAIFTRVEFHSTLQVLSNAKPQYLVIAALITLMSPVIRTRRWQTILSTAGYRLRYWQCFRLVMAAAPLTSITPSKSGDIVKAYYLRDMIPASVTIGSVITERVYDVFFLALLALAGMLLYSNYDYVAIVLPMIVGIIAALALIRAGLTFRLPLKESWTEKLLNIAMVIKGSTKDRAPFFTITAYSFCIWFLAIVHMVVFFRALDIDIPFMFALASVPLAIFVGLLPVTLGGMGTRDAAIILLFSQFATAEELLASGILFSAFRYWLPSLLGLPFMLKTVKEVS